MHKRLAVLILLFPCLMSGMERLRALVDRYPKTTGFVAGTLTAASLVEAYHVWHAQKNAETGIPKPIDTRILIASCNHIPRERANGDPGYFEQIEYYNYSIKKIACIFYNNPLEGKTDIYEENREDIKIILNKFSRIPGSLKTSYEHRSYNNRLSLTFEGSDSSNWFDRIDCTILLPRVLPEGQKCCKIQILGNDAILYERD